MPSNILYNFEAKLCLDFRSGNRVPSCNTYCVFFNRRLVVCLFAALGDALKPKSFAGLFSAAPSIALASLGLVALQNGKGVRRHRVSIYAHRRSRISSLTACMARCPRGSSVGLAAFALVVWKFLSQHSTGIVLCAGTIA
jgi:hypothetical protein